MGYFQLFCACLIAGSISHLTAFTSVARIASKRNALHGVSLKMGIDVTGLAFAPVSDELLNAATSTTGTWTDLSNALIFAGGLAFFAYEKRPRGSARDDLIEMRDSTVRGAGAGAFSKKFIPKGTIVGRYPGLLLTMSDALDSKESDAARTAAQSYFFAVDEDKVLDPTTRQGVMEDSLSFLGLLKTDTLIARINEPPLGGDVNLCTEIASNGVTVMAERDIFANEELFMDYGRDYDRSAYSMRPQEEEEEEVKIAPIMKRPKDLKETTEELPKVAPIVDKRASASSISVSASGSASGSMSAAISTASSSIFDSLIGNAQAPKDVASGKDSRSQGILGDGGDVKDKKGEISDGPLYRPALSLKESEELLSSLDSMSDEEVAAVLAKLQAAVKDRIQGEVSEALFNKEKSAMNDSIGKDLKQEMGEIKKMPRAVPVDPVMRQKYNKELEAIEDELERIYSDPLGVWTEFMKNPERFLNEGEIGDLAQDENFQ